MRKYETVIISDPDLQDQSRTDLLDKVRNIIAKENGIVLYVDDWGSKKLAYEINRKFRGHYICLTYGGTGDLVKELERNLRLSDDVMKYMTILVSADETAESLAKEAQDAEAAKAETAASQDAEKTADAETDKETDDSDADETSKKSDETVTDDQN
ncbi:30S ribosomal protein S6 [Desulfotignum phosphitoxidans]|jgi:small subunit ribosomal protein S6|uniref:Small ribosomal subunit protein bS6 n=1 Tax=Desulfotignum phosphitoxidans DSM 13687 TaxID=1286635 RepID=S0G1J9_9BACT|nr:30S ribosomal protein S6 [Desulfotignum phosphitoxidans]EMS80800.1 30S ribosomal protein S18 [Desulfotignum phosphitoxidans DSM 13687]